MKRVVTNEEAMIKHQVKLTASGAEGPTATKGPTKDPVANANAACKNAWNRQKL